MENQNEQSQQTETKEASVGGNGRSSFAEAIWGDEIKESGNKEPETSAAPSPDDAETGLLNIADAGTETAGCTGESEEPAELDVWQFGDQEYTAAQVEESLRDRELYQKYNQSVQPLIQAIEQTNRDTSRFKEMALTETEKTIEYLQKRIKSGQLDDRQRAAAYDQLETAKDRRRILEQAAEQAEKSRNDALSRVRDQNARQSVAALVKRGWSNEQIKGVAAVAQQVLGNKLADVLSPELMQIFRDAAELRATRESAAQRFKKKANDALKTTKQAPQKTVTTPAKRSKTFGSMIFGDE
ncbi:hypothetical protein DO726_08070 [Salmonella enterica subsp. enterica serovar Telelkebir]|nr:hypothetical protein [Salmonella enterica subsp. enterica serovar Telelkebir]